MNSKEKEVISKLLRVAENQQKILEKLAQQVSQAPAQTSNEAEIYEKYDPLSANQLADSSPEQAAINVKKNFPWLDAPKPTATKPEPPVSGAWLPQDLKAAIDKGAPGLKGSLMLDVNGKSVSVNYDGTRVKGGPAAVKAMLQKAVGNSYIIQDPIAVTGPELAYWAKSNNHY